MKSMGPIARALTAVLVIALPGVVGCGTLREESLSLVQEIVENPARPSRLALPFTRKA